MHESIIASGHTPQKRSRQSGHGVQSGINGTDVCSRLPPHMELEMSYWGDKDCNEHWVIH
jgi:hypothetical protein